MDTTEFQNQPWYSNNDYLENFLDSIGYPAALPGNGIVGAPEVRFWIPIKFWIYRDDNGVGGPTLFQLQNLMDNLNRRFNQTNNAMIGFYMKCDPTYINNSTHVTKTFTGASLLMAANNDGGSFNVHIIGNFASANTAGFSIPFLNASMIPIGSYTQGRANGDLAHEIGHLLGLAHTHQYSAWNWKCLTECISRTRTWPTFNLCPTRIISSRVCEATGDGLRDTQADDNLVSNNACFYNVNFGNDEWGDSYNTPPAGLQDRPNVFNIMSYNSATNCVDQFSRLQIGVMLWTLYFKKINNLGGWLNPISTFDDYEPDNDAITARDIQVNQIQERNFHQQWNRIGGYAYTTQCDIDWVRFIPTCNQTFDIQTSAITGRTNANTRLTLFNSALTQLAQNDDISTTNKFSKITLSLVAGQTYFIRVENMSANVTGYYNLNVSPTVFIINGDNNFCVTSTNYTIPNLPIGATVTWSVTPAGIATPNTPNATQTTLNKSSNGVVTLKAIITVCGAAITITKPNITVGTPSIPAAFAQRVGFSCYYDAAVNFSGSGTIVEFSFDNVTWQSGGQSGSTWKAGEWFSGPAYQPVYARTSNACGKGPVIYKNLYIPSPPNGCTFGPIGASVNKSSNGLQETMITGNSITIYPNPTSDRVIIETPSLSANEWLSIYNANGELLLKEKISKAKKVMDISRYKPGLYLFRVEKDSRLIKAEKIIKE